MFTYALTFYQNTHRRRGRVWNQSWKAVWKDSHWEPTAHLLWYTKEPLSHLDSGSQHSEETRGKAKGVYPSHYLESLVVTWGQLPQIKIRGKEISKQQN